MKTLSPEDIPLWKERFCFFNDAVIRKWSIEFCRTGTILETVIEAQDAKCSPSGWSFITLRLTGCSSLKYCDNSKENYQVLSNGLHILHEGDCVGLEFGDFIDDPESLLDLRTSPCHVVANYIEWGVQPVLPDQDRS